MPQLIKEMLENLNPGPVTKEQFEDIFQNFKKAFIERAMGTEMSNHRNDTSAKTVITDSGSVRIDVPRDREGNFESLSSLASTSVVSQVLTTISSACTHKA